MVAQKIVWMLNVGVTESRWHMEIFQVGRNQDVCSAGNRGSEYMAILWRIRHPGNHMDIVVALDHGIGESVLHDAEQIAHASFGFGAIDMGSDLPNALYASTEINVT